MYDLVMYKKDIKEIIAIFFDLDKNQKFHVEVSEEYVIAEMDINDHYAKEIDGVVYFENPNEKILYLDEYRGRYEE